MSFFQSIPSDITLYHSLHTSSAFRRDTASRYDKTFSATWSKPRSETIRKSQVNLYIFLKPKIYKIPCAIFNEDKEMMNSRLFTNL